MEKIRKVRNGTVISDKMNKTRIVQVLITRRHPLYKKVIRHRANFKVHDENNESHTGDTVKIMETRPLSKDKRWRLVEILRKKEVADIQPAEIGEVTESE